MTNCKRIFRKLLITAGLIAVAGVIVSVIHHYQLRAAVNQYRAELRAKGDLVELSQAVPPPVSPDRDGTAEFLRAIALEQADQTLISTRYVYVMKMVAPGKAAICSQQPDVRGIEYVRNIDSTNTWRELAAAVDSGREMLALLTHLTERPKLEFKYDYQHGFANDVPFTNLYPVQLKTSAKNLAVAGLANLHSGDSAAAVTNARAMLLLADAAQGQRLLYSEQEGIDIANMAQSLTWEILQCPKLTDTQLAGLQSGWASQDFHFGLQNALMMERLRGDILLARWRNTPWALQDLIIQWAAVPQVSAIEPEKLTLARKIRLMGHMFMWCHWWSYADELRALRGYEALRQAARDAGYGTAFLSAKEKQHATLDALGIYKLNNDRPQLLSGSETLHSILSAGILSMEYSFEKVIRFETARQIVITAIALKRYQLQHGEWPDQLAELVPQFLAAIPQDAMTGQSLLYHRKSDGTFLLYSVGEDGVDNGGDPTLPKEYGIDSFNWLSFRAHDWVWPQPATPAEIDAFYQSEQRRRQ